MPGPDATTEFDRLDEKMDAATYNFEHFQTGYLLADTRRTVATRGVQPGDVAPDFELLRAGGGTLRLSDLQGKPILLHFGSYT